jgi:predicted ATPase/class 3 adenylate cyclase
MPDLPSGTVTFLFTDLEGSTRQWEEHPDAMRRAVARHDQLLRQSVEGHGGGVFKTGGDAFCVAFQRAPAALAAALEAQLALTGEGWGEAGPLRARMALHTGTAEEREGDYFGAALNRAARLLAIGHGGQALLSVSTAELARDSLPEHAALRDLGQHRLKDLQRPERVFQLVHPGLAQDFPPLRSLESLPNNLPLQPTSFIGREKQIAELRRLLAGTRLLTLSGAAGSGKTRLALQLAAEILEEYPEGVWVVELAALTDPALVPQSVAAALGLRETPGRPLTETLSEALKPRKLLLVLDNCEHVVEACAQLAAALMRACPGVTLLVTSREALGAAGELVWPVPSLSTPHPGKLAATATDRTSELSQYEAVRLFIDRALLSQPAFSVTNQNAPAVAQICHRLDGIPLAIELAAGRVKVLSVEEIAARLDDRFRLLTGGSRTVMPRHQTLRAAIDWSYELLLQVERALLRRLSVFAGGWTLKAAEVVCAGEGIEPWEVLELQAHLIDKSLVLTEAGTGGETRYRLLGTIRQYAGDRLMEAGEAGGLRQRHLDWFLALAEQAGPKLRGSDQLLWLDRLEEEHDNLRAALEWSQATEGGSEAGLRIAGALYRFWFVRGYLTEGRQWLEGVLSASTEAAGLPRAKALHAAGYLAWGEGDLKRASGLLEEGLTLYRQLGDKRGLARTLNTLGVVTTYDEWERKMAFYEEGLSLAREIEARDLVATLLNNLGEIARIRGDSQRARQLYEEALQLNVGDQARQVPLINLGFVSFAQGDYDAARGFFAETLAIARRFGDKGGIAYGLEGLGGVYGLQGQAERAARLLGAAEALRKAISLPLQEGDRPDYDRFVAAARDGLGETAFSVAFAEGRAMALERAIEYALTDEPLDRPAARKRRKKGSG